jgi:paraquat-inducible protein B
MSKPVNRTMVGLFVVGAIVLIVVAIGVLGSGKLFKKQFKYFMVFEGSVKGLNVGSPVTFRGVKVGSVSSIRIDFNYATKTVTIVVFADLEEGQVQPVGMNEAMAEEARKQGQYTIMRELIARGLRARLETMSFVTGQLQVSLDFYPDRPAVFTGIVKTVQEIPTIPTPLQELAKTLESLPIEEIFNKLNVAVDGIATLVQSPDFKESIANLNTTLKDVQTLVRNADAQLKPLATGLNETIRDTQKLVKNIDSQVASLGPSLNETIGDSRKLIQKVNGSVNSVQASTMEMINTATAALKETEKVLTELRLTVGRDSPLVYRFTETLTEVEKSARALRILADYLERHPEALLRGKGESGGK